MKDPRLPHWEAVIQIVRYLKAHPGRGLLYKANGHLWVEAYIDADWAGSPSDRKSTTGYCTFLGGNLVTWRSKNKLLLPSLVQRLSIEPWHTHHVSLCGLSIYLRN